jgi:hypothetical protein
MTEGTRAQFEKMVPGDYVLFSEKNTGTFNYFAEVTAKITNKALGDYLWPVQPQPAAKSEKVNSWELIYFLKSVRAIDVSKPLLVELLGHKSNDNVAASRQLDSEKLAQFEIKHGDLLEWLHTNARLARESRPALRAVAARPEPAVAFAPSATVGKEYVPSTTQLTYDVRDQTYTYNSEKVERGKKGHVDTQEALAAFLRARGLVPRSPNTNEPDFDLAWMVGDTAFVAEVKSTTDDNVEHQLRLGLGQVLWYWQRLSGKHVRVVAVLVPETPPVDDEWLELCKKLGVLIAWPGKFDRLL